jgi:RNA polymerase sigma-70 factor, ECF subfamily
MSAFGRGPQRQQRRVRIGLQSDRHQRFAELIVRNQADVYRYILSVVGHRADSDELFQQTNLTLWTIWERYDEIRDFLPWAFAVAQNEIRNFLRRQQLRPRLLSDELIAELTARRIADHDVLSARQEALTVCLERLTNPQRELIDLCYSQGRSMKAVAQERGQTADAIYKAVQRIRQSLYDCVNRSIALSAEL